MTPKTEEIHTMSKAAAASIRRLADAGMLAEELSDPTPSYGLIPLLRLNDEVDAAQLEFQLRELSTHGIRSVYLYAERGDWHFVAESGVGHEGEPSGMPYEYLGEDWERVLVTMLETARSLGMHVWIYDECDWPSGQAGGRVLEDESTAYRYVEVTTTIVSGPSRHVVKLDDAVVGACLLPADGRGDMIPIEVPVGADEVEVDVPRGSSELRLARKVVGSGWWEPVSPDLTSAVTCERFCAETYDWYDARIPSELRDVVGGYFTDEPTSPPTLMSFGGRFPFAPAIPWSDQAADAFVAEKGYDIRPWLALLGDVAAVGAVPRDVRVDYWDMVSRAYANEYFGRIRERCDAQGVIFTGHLMGEEQLDYLLAFQAGDPMRLYAHFSVPGMDWIAPFGAYDDIDLNTMRREPGRPLGLKLIPSFTPLLATSSAAIHGSPRVLSETYSGVGFGATPHELRQVADWQFAHGINMHAPISFKYSLRGWNRMLMYPGLGHQQPYWRHVEGLTRHVSRMSVLTAAGEQVCSVGIVFPAALLWEHYAEPGRLASIDQAFRAIVEAVLDAGRTVCLIGPDDAIAAHAADGSLHVGDQSPASVVVPRGSFVDVAGGDAAVASWRAAGVSVVEVDLEAPPSPAHVAEGLADGEAVAVSCRDRALVRHHVRRGRDFVSVCVVQRGTDDEAIEVEFSDRAHAVFVSDPVTAGLVQAADAEGRVAVVLEPLQARVVVAATTAEAAARLQDVAEQPSLPAGWADGECIASPPASAWRCELAPTMGEPDLAWQFDGYDPETANGAWEEHVGSLRPGDWAEQGMGGYSGGVRYHTTLAVPALSSGARLVLDLGEVAVGASLVVNGRALGNRCFAPYAFDITDAVVEGSNDIVVEVTNTLANHFSQFEELADVSVIFGGTVPGRLRSGLLGPVRLVRA